MTGLTSFRLATVCLIVASASLTACDAVDSIIDDVHHARLAIQQESVNWRGTLTKLAEDLKGLESKVAGDTKAILADTTNEVQGLANATIDLADAKVSNLIAQAGGEFRCNADFVKTGALAALDSIIEDLQFWKDHKTHSGKRPSHSVCWIGPSNISLYPVGNDWAIDASNMSEPGIVHVYGYNFWPQSIPKLELHDANGQKSRNINLVAAYVTRYQINLDFSTENFAGVKPGYRVVFKWPDQDDPNTISITQRKPGLLKISDPTFTPPTAAANGDPVTLRVTITNTGGTRSGNAVLFWRPDQQSDRELPISLLPLEPGQTRVVSFPPYVYQRGGRLASTVYLNNGDDSLPLSLTVASPASPPPPAAPTIKPAACPVPIGTFDLNPTTTAPDLVLSGDKVRVAFAKNPRDQFDQIRVVLQTESNITWWKSVELQNQNGRLLSAAETQDNIHGPVTAAVKVLEGDSPRLILFKAGLFGVHTQMYCVGDLTLLPGYTTTFTWLKD